MEQITIPMSKMDKIRHLINIAENLNIKITVDLFDNLLDKYDFNKHLFDYMLETINLGIIEKIPFDETKYNFKVFLKCDTIGEAQKNIMLSNVNQLEYE